MDGTSTTIMSIVGLVLGVSTTVIGVINHKRIRSNCCGKNISASFDIEQTTPTQTHPSRPSAVPSIEL